MQHFILYMYICMCYYICIMYFLLVCTCMSINCVYFSFFFFFYFYFFPFFFLYLSNDKRSASCYSNVHTDERFVVVRSLRGMYVNRDIIFFFFYVNHGCILLFLFLFAHVSPIMYRPILSL